MYIINLSYKVPLDEIERYLVEHVEYLDEQYALGNFLASGRKNPRTGGVILARVTDKSKVMEIINKDPFKMYDLADFEVTEFIPTKTCKDLDFLKE